MLRKLDEIEYELSLRYYPKDEIDLTTYCKTNAINQDFVGLLGVTMRMVSVMQANKGIGLAAPQVGINARLIVLGGVDHFPLTEMIEPIILEYSKNSVYMEEGCLSFPGAYAKVSRPASCVVQWQDLSRKLHQRHTTGIEARVIQHEIDHLNGILFIDRLTPREREIVLARYLRSKGLPK